MARLFRLGQAYFRLQGAKVVACMIVNDYQMVNFHRG